MVVSQCVLVGFDSLFPVLIRYWVCVGFGVIILATAHSSFFPSSLLLIIMNKHRGSIALDKFYMCVVWSVVFLLYNYWKEAN